MEEQKKNPAQGLSESEQVQVRRQKLADLQAAGHDPFTLTKYPQDAYSADRCRVCRTGISPGLTFAACGRRT